MASGGDILMAIDGLGIATTSVGKPGPGFEKVGFGFSFQKTRVPGSGFGF